MAEQTPSIAEHRLARAIGLPTPLQKALDDYAKRMESRPPSPDFDDLTLVDHVDGTTWPELTRVARMLREILEFDGGPGSMGQEYGNAYRLFKLITGTAVRYAAISGQAPNANDVRELTDELVTIAAVCHTTVAQPEDLVQRFYLALANVLWAAHDPELLERARDKAKGHDSVQRFVGGAAAAAESLWEREQAEEAAET